MGYEIPINMEATDDDAEPINKAYQLTFIEDESADPEVKDLPITWRACRFPEENKDIWTFKYYSYSACLTHCKLLKKIELCNCTDRQVGQHLGKSIT